MPRLAVALAETVMVPATVEPLVGAVIDTVGPPLLRVVALADVDCGLTLPAASYAATV
jgi:hypothetical protein